MGAGRGDVSREYAPSRSVSRAPGPALSAARPTVCTAHRTAQHTQRATSPSPAPHPSQSRSSVSRPTAPPSAHRACPTEVSRPLYYLRCCAPSTVPLGHTRARTPRPCDLFFPLPHAPPRPTSTLLPCARASFRTGVTSPPQRHGEVRTAARPPPRHSR